MEAELARYILADADKRNYNINHTEIVYEKPLYLYL